MMFNRDSKANENKVPRGPTVNDSCEQFDTAAMVLGQALLRFLERSNSRIAEKVLESLIPMASQLTKVETQQKQSSFQLDSIEKILSNLSSHSKLLENASQTNLLLGRQHYEDYIIQPMVRSLFTVIDIIEDARKSWKDNNCQTEQDQAELVEAIKVQLEQFLQNYGIKVIRHQPGSQFNPQLMKPVSKVPTTDKKLDDLVAMSLQAGFIWNQQRLLRQESVSIYKFTQTHINPIKEKEGGVL
ncbi:MAG: nucleotide exchange factor GrpE [Planctomycetes bacterium]|nr:nucleotide exchange factor GrpE [Planctomycetota bacterium]